MQWVVIKEDGLVGQVGVYKASVEKAVKSVWLNGCDPAASEIQGTNDTKLKDRYFRLWPPVQDVWRPATRRSRTVVAAVLCLCDVRSRWCSWVGSNSRIIKNHSGGNHYH